MYKIRMLRIVFAFLLVIFASGCGFVDRFLHEDEYFYYYSKQHEIEKSKLIEKHKQDIGMSKDMLKKKYGLSKDIEYNVKYFIKEEQSYDYFEERWGYPFHTGIKFIHGNVWQLYFYFNNGKVVRIDSS